MSIRLSDAQHERARRAVRPALDFLERQDNALPGTLIRYLWCDGDPDDVARALAAYQNADGGFGNRLEQGIHAPESNPFAARVALQTLVAVPATDRAIAIRDRLSAWLTSHQNADGDWHFAPALYDDVMQPWFAGWTFPSLNPACCLAGLASALNIATPTMLERVDRLFQAKASLEEARAGAFYRVLPYVEYTFGVTVPDQETWLDALAENIITTEAAGKFDDANHYFTLALGGSPELARRILEDVWSRQIDRRLDAQQDDGGWSTAYDPGWRPKETSDAFITLARLETGI